MPVKYKLSASWVLATVDCCTILAEYNWMLAQFWLNDGQEPSPIGWISIRYETMLAVILKSWYSDESGPWTKFGKYSEMSHLLHLLKPEFRFRTSLEDVHQCWMLDECWAMRADYWLKAGWIIAKCWTMLTELQQNDDWMIQKVCCMLAGYSKNVLAEYRLNTGLMRAYC